MVDKQDRPFSLQQGNELAGFLKDLMDADIIEARFWYAFIGHGCLRIFLNKKVPFHSLTLLQRSQVERICEWVKNESMRPVIKDGE